MVKKLHSEQPQTVRVQVTDTPVPATRTVRVQVTNATVLGGTVRVPVTYETVLIKAMRLKAITDTPKADGK